MMHEKISACIMTYNEKDNIRRCLQSVDWCDEIVVLDSYSTDATVEICREFTPRVYQREWQGYVAQRNHVCKMATHPWVLFLDADEEMSLELRQAIRDIFERGVGEMVGFEFPRQVYYLGRWIRHGCWYPDYKLRLFRREHACICGVEPHDTVVIDGPVQKLPFPIRHYTYRDIRDHIQTLNHFSSISAQGMYECGRRFRWADFMLRPMWRFIKGYILRGGWLDGRQGLLIASINAFGVGLKYAKLWELQNGLRTQRSPAREQPSGLERAERPAARRLHDPT